MSAASGFVFLYTTLPDEEVARAIAADLVRAKLAACVNIHAPMTSVYEWEGKLETGGEVACFIKTRESLVPEAMEALRKRHPYSVPAMLVLPIVAGNEDYLVWARRRTRE
jgi:periplasmic divalent cation tolerance protein